LILEYQNEEDFVIELKTQSEGDRLILAKVQPKSDFGDTVRMVSGRIEKGQTQTMETNDKLTVPRIKLDLTRKFSEIEGLHLISSNTNVAKDLILMSTVQNTVFDMNEKGVELRSESHMAFGCAEQMEPVAKHTMIFDKPFLVLMQRRDAKMPYFALWVDNPELLVTWK
jgi:serine protease inhibitor